MCLHSEEKKIYDDASVKLRIASVGLMITRPVLKMARSYQGHIENSGSGGGGEVRIGRFFFTPSNQKWALNIAFEAVNGGGEGRGVSRKFTRDKQAKKARYF